MNKKELFIARNFRILILSSITLISSMLTIYAFFFNKTYTKLDFQVTDDIKVYDLNSESSKIDIFYNKKPLDKECENLRVINLKIVNSGSEKILKSFYDENDRLGLYVENGVLLENPEIIKTSNSYLQKNLKISTDSLGNIYFSNVILEPDEYYSVKLLIKHQLDSIYRIKPLGKIAGIKELKIIDKIVDSEYEKGFSPFVKKTFYGNLYIQLTRFFTYGLVVLIVMITIIIIIIQIQEKKKQKKNKNAS